MFDVVHSIVLLPDFKVVEQMRVGMHQCTSSIALMNSISVAISSPSDADNAKLFSHCNRYPRNQAAVVTGLLVAPKQLQ